MIDSATYPCCFAYASQQVQNLPAGSTIALDTFKTNVGGFTLTSEGRVVVPKAGKYIIAGGIGGLFNANTGWVRINRVGGGTITSVIDRSNTTSVYKSINVGGFTVNLPAGAELYLNSVDAVVHLGNGGLENSNFLSLAMIP